MATSPTEIRLQFNESVEPRFSGITLVKDGDSAPISTGAAETDPKDHSTLIVKVQTSLSAGIYKVKWHAVSVDTHNGTIVVTTWNQPTVDVNARIERLRTRVAAATREVPPLAVVGCAEHRALAIKIRERAAR